MSHYLPTSKAARRVASSRPCSAMIVRQQGHQCERLRALNAGKLLGADGDRRADRHGIENLHDISRTHSNTAEAGCFAKGSLFRCSVNVDASSTRILIARFIAVQPQDPRDDRIASARIDPENLAVEASAFENRPLGQIAAELSAYAKPAQRGLVTSEIISESKLRGGNRKSSYNDAVLNESQSLLRHTDDDFDTRRRLDGLSPQEALRYDEHEGQGPRKA